MGQEPRRRRSPARFAAVISCSRDAVSSRDAHDTRLAVNQNPSLRASERTSVVVVERPSVEARGGLSERRGTGFGRAVSLRFR
jgi:hypothetical protein